MDTDTTKLEETLDAFPGVEVDGGMVQDGWPSWWSVVLNFEDSRQGRHAREYLAWLATEVGPVELKMKAAMPVPEEPGAQSYWVIQADAYTPPENVAAEVEARYEEAYEATPEAVCDAVETA